MKINIKIKKILIRLIYFIIFLCIFATISLAIKTAKPKNHDITTAKEINDTIDIAGEEINIEDLENFSEDFLEGNNSEEISESTNQLEPNTAKPNSSQKSSNSKSNTSSVPKTSSSSARTKYYIKVNYGANVVTIYTNDENGDFSIPVKAMVCSTGRATPKSGTYKVQSRWEWLGLIGNVYGHYSTQIVGNILFHSVPYLKKYDPASLEYWEYDKLGTTASAGCIRLTVADAKWIYNNIPRGTSVEFYSSGDPGPLRKTISKKNFF